MILPDKIEIGWRTFQVKEWDKGSTSSNVAGSCDILKGSISVDLKDTDDEYVLNTFLHEILHGIYGVYNLSSESDEEKTVETLANGLIEVLKRNPALTKIFSNLNK